MDNELSRVVNALPGLVWTALPDGHIDFYNRRWCEYTDLRVDEAGGQGWHTIIHPDDLPTLVARWRSIVVSGEPGDMVARLRRLDGEYRWFLISTNPMRNKEGQIVKWFGVSTDIEDRRRAEEALRLRELSFSLIVESIPVPVAVTTPSGEVETLNRPTLEYFGKTFEELKGWKGSEVVHPDDLQHTIAAQMKAHETGSAYNVESRHLRFDGVYRWFNVLGLPLRDTDGSILRWFHILIDIDDQKRAEATLAAEKRLLGLVARGVPLPDVLEELCREVEDAAPGRFCSILLVDPGAETFSVGAGPILSDAYKAVLSGQTIDPDHDPAALAIALKAPVITTDPTSDPRWATSPWLPLMAEHGLRSCWAMPILSVSQDVLGVFAAYGRKPEGPTPGEMELIDQFIRIAGVAIARAMADAVIKAGEAEVRRAYDSLADAQRLSRTGSFIVDTLTDDHTWSDEAYRIFEFEPATKVTRQRVREAVHPDDLHIHESVYARRSEGEDVTFNYRIVTASGAVKYLRGLEHLIEGVAGRPLFIGAIQDVTETRVAEQALDKARSELNHAFRAMSLGVLTASIAHEVNQPLAGIMTNASTCLRMLSADPPNLDGARTTVQRTIRDGNRASEVIQRLRGLFARKPPGMEPIDLNEAAREVLALSSSELQRRSVVLHTDLADGVPAVSGDRVQLQQVILNLILNAADAMSEMGDRPRDMRIATRRDEIGEVTLSVSDAGVGIEPANLERLFDTFYTTKADGMGIGLSISRSIIEAHQGRLWATENDGPGATFWFSIPCRGKSLADADDAASQTLR